MIKDCNGFDWMGTGSDEAGLAAVDDHREMFSKPDHRIVLNILPCTARGGGMASGRFDRSSLVQLAREGRR